MRDYLSVLRNAFPQNYRLLLASGIFVILLSIALGTTLGKLLSLGAYVGDYEPLITNDQPLPSRIYDINNNLIAEISQGSRELLAQNELTRNLIYALMGREDSSFFDHNGFSLIGTMRALTYIVLDKFFQSGTAGGGSTLTQQLAGSLKANRSNDRSVSRKLRELWWSFIFEKYYAKSEILVTYLNNVYFGQRNYGIEAASRFFFGHSARDNSVVESALAVIQLARPNGDFSPLRQPEMARLRQEAVLDKIVELKLMTREQVELASQQYWDSFDLTKISQQRPKRIDAAPYFTDYVARILSEHLYGTNNLLQAGYSIYTTLDLGVQQQIDQIVAEEMNVVDNLYQSQNSNLFTILEEEELPDLARLRSIFGLDLDLSGGRAKRATEQTLKDEIAPTLEAAVTALGLEQQIPTLKLSVGHLDKFFARTVPETAMMAVDNRTGNIVAMVGGRTYNINEARLFNRAVDARVPPGSAFKPLYYAAAFEDRAVTGSTPLADGPYRFVNPNGEPYFPANYYAGRFKGTVLPRRALQLSLNIPAVHVLDMAGFARGIGTATRLLDISDPKVIRRDFPYVFPVALGTAPVSPMQLLRAYTAFVNRGIPIEPNPIRYVEDRNGQVVLNYEQENLRHLQDNARRVLSEQTAYVMTTMLESVPNGGTLYSSKLRYEEKYGRFEFPLAAKTGTAENWSDGWVAGYTPNYSAVVWVGFDRAGNSLGELLYGGRAAGPMFLRTMALLNQDEPKDVDFERPEGVSLIAIDKRNGYLWEASCGKENQTHEWFLEGTGPTEYCTAAPQTSIFNYNIVNPRARDTADFVEQEPSAIDVSSFDFLYEPLTNDLASDDEFSNEISEINETGETESLGQSQGPDGGQSPQEVPSANVATPWAVLDEQPKPDPEERVAPQAPLPWVESPASTEEAVGTDSLNIQEQVLQGESKFSVNTESLENVDQFQDHEESSRLELDSLIESDN